MKVATAESRGNVGTSADRQPPHVAILRIYCKEMVHKVHQKQCRVSNTRTSGKKTWYWFLRCNRKLRFIDTRCARIPNVVKGQQFCIRHLSDQYNIYCTSEIIARVVACEIWMHYLGSVWIWNINVSMLIHCKQNVVVLWRISILPNSPEALHNIKNMSRSHRARIMGLVLLVLRPAAHACTFPCM